jgi:hypothetical protein
MGRIADAALELLAAGPRAVDEIGAELSRRGATRARDPGAAVRRALRDDPRVATLDDGRLVSIAQALDGVTLSAVVSEEAARAGAVEIEPDLSPLVALGLGPVLPLPTAYAPGESVVVRVLDALVPRFSIEPAARLGARPADEAALVEAVAARLARHRPEAPWAAPPIVHLATVALAVMASSPGAFRGPGRSLSEALAAAGYEVHLGWVGPPGTLWESLTEEEVDALEDEVADLLLDERLVEAATVQGRLVTVLDRHLPDRAPQARRRWAGLLARSGRPDEGLSTLRGLFPRDDPEDRYEAALIALRNDDLALSRRMVQEGLARSQEPDQAEVALCLADLGDDIDAQAAFLRLRGTLSGPEAGEDLATRVARAIVGPRRSYLVEAMVEELFGGLPPAEAMGLLEAMVEEAGETGREACLACSRILPARQAALARRLAGGDPPTRPAVAGVLEARPVAAWATAPEDAPDQQQLILAVGKEGGRLAPLVALVDFVDMAGALKDAFFLPDLVEPRLRREILAPMGEIGLPPWPVELEDAVDALDRALRLSSAARWRLPSEERQPVLERIERWIFRPARGGPAGS